jgi:DNA-binding MarR family transcriptional regulator
MNTCDEDLEKLVAGKVPEEYLDLLYHFGAEGYINPPVKAAVTKHLCDGISQSEAEQEMGVKQSSISRQIKILQKINQKALRSAWEHSQKGG